MYIQEIFLELELNNDELEIDYQLNILPALAGAKNQQEIYIEYLKYENEKSCTELQQVEDIINAIQPKIEQFNTNFNAYFEEYSVEDIMILKLAFFHYRNKVHILDSMEDKKNPKNFETPYINALTKLQSIYEHIGKEPRHMKVLEEAFKIIEEDIQTLSITKRDIQREKNEIIEAYLNKLQNKKLSNNKILEEFKTLNEIINS